MLPEYQNKQDCSCSYKAESSLSTVEMSFANPVGLGGHEGGQTEFYLLLETWFPCNSLPM